MSYLPLIFSAIAVLHLIITAACVYRIILYTDRSGESRLAWIFAVYLFPLVGVLAYVIFGEVYIDPKKLSALKKIKNQLSQKILQPLQKTHKTTVNKKYEKTASLVGLTQGFAPVTQNSFELMQDSRQYVQRLVDDIDGATSQIHILYYIWLDDHTGRAIAQALIRACERGVVCRVLVDDIGSSNFIKSQTWQGMIDAGVHCLSLLPMTFNYFSPFNGRVDLRNHRKICVIDNTITYCGSQNCADPEFLVKPKYAPWVDIMTRITGPVAVQNQAVFLSDWLMHSSGALSDIALPQSSPSASSSMAMQITEDGPTTRHTATPNLLATMIHSAEKEVIITTPYFVPTESVIETITSAAYRGVKVSLTLPAKNDSFVVKAISESHYTTLLDAGVVIYEYSPGVLHSKIITIDGEVSMIGSSNLDRRSFRLNYENNIIIYDASATAQIVARQRSYHSQSVIIDAEVVAAWSKYKKIKDHLLAISAPLM